MCQLRPKNLGFKPKTQTGTLFLDESIINGVPSLNQEGYKWVVAQCFVRNPNRRITSIVKL